MVAANRAEAYSIGLIEARPVNRIEVDEKSAWQLSQAMAARSAIAHEFEYALHGIAAFRANLPQDASYTAHGGLTPSFNNSYIVKYLGSSGSIPENGNAIE